MATYSRVTPASLPNFSLVIDDPTTSEDANKLSDIDLQTRRFVYDFLSSKFDITSSDTLLPAAVSDASLAGKVKGSTANVGGSQRGIVQGTISTPDLRDGSVTSSKLDGSIPGTKLQNSAITTDQLANAPNGVTTAKINDGSVTEAKLANNAVTGTKLSSSASVDSDRAVNTDHIKDSAITADKITDGAVGSDQLLTASEAQILIAQPTTGKFSAKSVTGVIAIDKDGLTTLNAIAYACIREYANNNVAGGATAAATWNVRGVAIGWYFEFDTSSSMTFAAVGKVRMPAGTYIVRGSFPVYKSDLHIARLSRYNSSDTLLESFVGSSGYSPAAGSIQDRSHLTCKITVTSSDYFRIEHWTQSAEAVDGLGLPTNNGDREIYGEIFIQRIA